MRDNPSCTKFETCIILPHKTPSSPLGTKPHVVYAHCGVAAW